MKGYIEFSLVTYSVDGNGNRELGAQPLLFRLRTVLQDFTVSTQGFPEGLFASGWRPRLQDSVLRVVRDEGGASGPWPELSTKRAKDKNGREIPGSSYAERKAREFPGAQILQRTGRMLQSLFSGDGYVFEQTATTMKWGSDDPVVGYHFRGHDEPTRLPRRRVFDPNAEELRNELGSDAVRYEHERGRELGFHEAKVLGLRFDRVAASQLGMGTLAGDSSGLSEQLSSLGGS